MNDVPANGPLEEIHTLTLTALESRLAVLLAQHECIVFERGRNTIDITFPANTQQQMMWPRTHVERFRIVLADGLELLHERNENQKRSELAVALTQ